MRWFLILACVAGLGLLAGAARPLPGEAVPWQPLFISTAGPRWIDRAAQVQSESGFNPTAMSRVKNKTGEWVPCAYGPAQFTPPTWAIWGRPGTCPQDPAAALDAQHRYMLWLEARTASFDAALGSYNAGLGSIRKAQRLADSLGMVDSAAWLRTLPRVTGEAHAGETRGYIVNNARFRAQIRARWEALHGPSGGSL